ncbi:rhamnan synthesis F family protein [Achromobacter xylosoxidans]|uniref:rhamnan synthesis F family protein n=1 Tax=Alcaligenes xylosoxydans xylosoxydans TaxID=85698 RepID=UPI0015E85401|nr:rhamnan synthesis F family protein [Achromobacter xylosoxidans]
MDVTFRAVLDDLEAHCDTVILVTTCEIVPQDLPTGAKIQIIWRPNIGYDFYSYRVGLAALQQQGGCERVLLLNSSYLITDSNLHRQTLSALLQRLEHADIAGVTQSNQWRWHLQSYLLALRGEVLSSAWLQSWLSTVSPRNSKIETILSGELSLSSAILVNRAKVSVLFQPSARENQRAKVLWGYKSLSLKKLPHLFRRSFWRALPQFNPTHFQALPLALQTGLVKTELVRNNPHHLNLAWLPRICPHHEFEAITHFITRSRPHYLSKSGSLTALETTATPLPWHRIVHSSPVGRPGVRVAVVAHIFYPELANEIYDLVRNIVEPFDLIITTPHEGAVADLIDTFADLASSVTVSLSENRGRDVGPFLAVHRGGMLERYDAVLKLHSKKSTYSDKGQYWQQSLFSQLCGNSHTVNRTLALLRSGKVGMVGPHDYYLTHPHYWGANQATVRKLTRSLPKQMLPDTDLPLGFFAGTMFWFAPKAMTALHDIPEELLDFEPENGKQDGTLAHALERLFGALPRMNGYNVTSLVLAGRDFNEITTDGHTVPVLRRPPETLGKPL